MNKEVKIYLESNGEGQSLKLSLPGSNGDVTLNFSADAVAEMRNSVSGNPSSIEGNSSKSNDSVSAKSVYPCQLCSKSFPNKTLLDRHQAYHVATNPSCELCGKLFYKRWALEQHMAVDHEKGKKLNCNECGKQFMFERNLLAHVQLHHAEEKRRRCKFCPLTFLKKKYYIKHQTLKHPDQPATWCKLCLEIFDHLKQREDHECPRLENTGRNLICHRHEKSVKFSTRSELEKHLKEHHENERANEIKCPVCHKGFLLRKNLNCHIRRFHSGEDEKRKKFNCSQCKKAFLYESDMKEHENTHRDEALYGCDKCERKYSSKKALKCHKKLAHGNGEVFKCNICSKKLSTKYKLKYHMTVHSEKRFFKCSVCDVKFKARENLKKHTAKFHASDKLKEK